VIVRCFPGDFRSRPLFVTEDTAVDRAEKTGGKTGEKTPWKSRFGFFGAEVHGQFVTVRFGKKPGDPPKVFSAVGQRM
jgi:hypothetical protein